MTTFGQEDGIRDLITDNPSCMQNLVETIFGPTAHLKSLFCCDLAQLELGTHIDLICVWTRFCLGTTWFERSLDSIAVDNAMSICLIQKVANDEFLLCRHASDAEDP